MERSTWKSTTGFLLAAIGSAIGLGNIWRFSFLCHKNGGGSFLVPYLIALFTIGIPLLILEFAIGHKMRASAPKSMHQIHPEWEWLGWWPVLFVMFGINLYYVVVIAWCGLYMLFSLRSILPWEGSTESFFFSEFLGLTGGVFEIGGIQPHIFGMTAAIWFLMWFICIRKIDKGVELACKVFMPLLVLVTTVLVFWGLTLEGAGAGIRQYLRPEWSKLGEVRVWRDAFGQIFFSLSVGFGIMIAYASYLPPKTDLVRSAFITAGADSFFSIFAGFAVFSVLGFMAHATGTGVQDVIRSGPGLCFVVYPEAISRLPALNSLFGFLFFLTLLLAGITSAISILEAFTSATIDKFGWKRPAVVTTTCIIGLFGSLIFVTGAGLHWLDIVDHFLTSYGLITVGLLECLLIVWYYKIDHLHFHLSDITEGGYPKVWDMWWEWSVKFVAPAVLFTILAWSAAEDLTRPYEGYPTRALALIGVGWLVGTFLLSGIFSVYTKHRVDSTMSL